MNWANFRFCIVALLVLLAVGWARAQPVRVPDDSVASVTLENGQYLCNFGERLTRTKPLRVIRKGTGPGFVAHRPTATDPHGQTINLTLHGFAMRDWVFVAASGARYEPSAVYNAGVEEPTIENVVVDAPCSVAKVIWTTVDLWGIAVPHGPTLSGGNIVSMRLYGPGGVGFLAVGEVTDLYAGQISTSGSGPARFQFHAVPQYQWPQWSPAGQPKKPLATSEGRPKRIVFADTRMSEGSYVDGVVYSKQAEGLAYPSGYKTIEGPIYRPVMKVQSLGVATPGGGTSGGPGSGGTDTPPQPPPATQPASGLPVGIPAPEWGMDVRTDAPANRRFSGGAFPYLANPGDVIEIAAGNYPASIDRGYLELTARGTPERPVIIRGVGKPRIGQKLYLKNSDYVYLTGFDFHGVVVSEGCDHWVIADSRVGSGGRLELVNGANAFPSRHGGGMAVTATDTNPNAHGLIIRCQIVDNGDFSLGEAAETHGITINGAVSYVTVLDCELARNSGDGMQINGGAMDYSGAEPHCKLNNIRIGRVDAHDNRQVGIALKQASDVIISSSQSHGHVPFGANPSAWGAGFGLQYGPARVWLINCESYDNISGASGGSSNGPGGAWYFINFYALNNTRANDRRTSGSQLQAPGDSWGPAGLAIAGSPDVTVIGATLRNNDAGLNFPGGQRIAILGSIIDGLQQAAGNAAFIYDTQYLRELAFVGNAIAPGSERFARGQQRSALAPWLAAFGSVARASGNVIATGGTWTPTDADKAVFAEFKRRYGLDIDVDFSGKARPAGMRKIGALE